MGIGNGYLIHTFGYCLMTPYSSLYIYYGINPLVKGYHIDRTTKYLVWIRLLLKTIIILSSKIIMSSIDTFIDIICCLKIIKISGWSRIKLAINFIIWNSCRARISFFFEHLFGCRCKIFIIRLYFNDDILTMYVYNPNNNIYGKDV